jgi:hypothetical protein
MTEEKISRIIRDKNKVGSLAVIAISVRNYLRPITLRPTLSDSLPFSAFCRKLFSFLFILFPNFVGFRRKIKKFLKIFFIHRFSNWPISQLEGEKIKK